MTHCTPEITPEIQTYQIITGPEDAYREKQSQTDGPERGTILRSANTDPELRAPVTLFKPSGKYYTAETWRIPVGAIGPHDMTRSPDFRRIDGGPVLVQSEISAGNGQDGAAAWGYDALLLADGTK